MRKDGVIMNYEQFKKEIMEAVEEQLKEQAVEGITLRNDEIMAADGMTDRLIVSMEGSNISMAFRFKEIYENYNGDIEAQAVSLVENIKENLQVKDKEADVKNFITNYEMAKDHMLLRLISGDSPALAETPHEMIEDMALVVSLQLESFSDDNGRACCVVTDSLMELYGVSKEELFEVARANSLEQEPVKITPMTNVIANILNDEDVPVPGDMGEVAYIATNASGFHGAAVLGYPDFAEKAAQELGGSFYLIPSSVHEFILIKDDGRCGAKSFNSMIKDVNETILSPRDRLSEQCYHYNAKTKTLENGLKHDNKVKEKKVGAR